MNPHLVLIHPSVVAPRLSSRATVFFASALPSLLSRNICQDRGHDRFLPLHLLLLLLPTSSYLYKYVTEKHALEKIF